jgi:hypothetical protein
MNGHLNKPFLKSIDALFLNAFMLLFALCKFTWYSKNMKLCKTIVYHSFFDSVTTAFSSRLFSFSYSFYYFYFYQGKAQHAF